MVEDQSNDSDSWKDLSVKGCIDQKLLQRSESIQSIWQKLKQFSSSNESIKSHKDYCPKDSLNLANDTNNILKKVKSDLDQISVNEPQHMKTADAIKIEEESQSSQSQQEEDRYEEVKQ